MQVLCKRCEASTYVPSTYVGTYPLCPGCRSTIGLTKYVEKTVATTRLGYVQKNKAFSIPIGLMLQEKPTR